MSKHRPVVAVVDDDPVVLEALEDLLEAAGYSARGFQSAASLLLSGLSDLDALITDIGMPGMDGFQRCNAVNSARPEMPVFLMTGRHDIEGKQAGPRPGVFSASRSTLAFFLRRSETHWFDNVRT
ncbi:FixJ family two-component response regulator [Ensifer sp. 4252]